MAEERDFLNRWSQRKANARDGLIDEAEAEVAALQPEPEVQAPLAPANEQGASDADEIPEELKGIDIDSLGYKDDFTVFMKAGVPDALRRKALRRLWRSDPVLACLDGLNDYEEDFTDAAVAVTGLKSAYRIGKGYLFAEDEEAEADVAAGTAEAAAEPEAEDTAAEAEGDGAEAEAGAEVATGDADGTPEAAADETDPAEVAAGHDAATDPEEKA